MRAASTGRKHSEETKRKISERRKAYLEANPDKVPYLMNHYSKGPSYPERYFADVFTNAGLIFTTEKRVGLYSLDFAFEDKLIDVEINGSQHYDDQRIVESDKRRREFLLTRGWTMISVDWRAYQKLSREEKEAYVADLISFIRSASDKEPVIPQKPKHVRAKKQPSGAEKRRLKRDAAPQTPCPTCGTPTKNKHCSDACAKVSQRKCTLSNDEIYEIWIKNGRNFLATSREVGISDNAIRKRIKNRIA